jgi:hypothetical protein
MIQRVFILAALTAIIGSIGQLSAHDDFRIIGTLEKHQGSTIVVKKNAGNTVSLRLDKQTAVTQDKKAVGAAALKIGQTLVIDAYGDEEQDSLAVEIRIVPPIRGVGR